MEGERGKREGEGGKGKERALHTAATHKGKQNADSTRSTSPLIKKYTRLENRRL